MSLDAPIVVVAWMALVGHELQTAHSPALLTLVFNAVWLGYAADRWLDGRQPRTSQAREIHRFYLRHDKTVLAIWILIISGSLLLASQTLNRHEWTRGVTLVALSLAYTALAQKGRTLHSYSLQKALGTALLLALSTVAFLPLATLSQPATLLTAATLTLLFYVNCQLCQRHAGKACTRSFLPATGFAAVAGGVCLFGPWPIERIGIATLASLVLLFGYARWAKHPSSETEKLGFDLCLLTPLPLLYFSP